MSNNEEQPVLNDLQGLLRESIGKDVIVVDYQTSMLLPKGENYGSTMLKVDALLKKTKDAPEEEMHFVAKMIPMTEYQKKHMKFVNSCNKEIFVIRNLATLYRQLEREAGVKEEDLIDIFPKYYGGRLIDNAGNPEAADDDVVMLLENLKVRGYVTMDRFNGMDFEHMCLAMKEYARFHALGTALRIKKPEEWEAAKEPINAAAFEMPKNEFDDVTAHTIDLLCADSRISKYSDRVRQAFEISKGFDNLIKTTEIEPWISIIHGDGWVNNLLYHHAEDGKVDDVKFVDYQIARISSPQKDLPYFLCACGNIEVMDNHFDELLDIYYDKYIEVLGKIGCDVSPFTKESFLDQLDRDAKDELFHCIIVLKIITMQVPQNMDMNDMKSSLFMATSNQLFIDRSWKIISKFVEKGWI